MLESTVTFDLKRNCPDREHSGVGSTGITVAGQQGSRRSPELFPEASALLNGEY